LRFAISEKIGGRSKFFAARHGKIMLPPPKRLHDVRYAPSFLQSSRITKFPYNVRKQDHVAETEMYGVLLEKDVFADGGGGMVGAVKVFSLTVR